VKEIYIEAILLIERLHRRFLDVIKTELDRLKIEDINNIQTLILYNINTEQLTIGELTVRGYYLGSNVSYNVKKLVENNYLVQERSPHDKRSTRVKLSEKGLTLCQRIDELYHRNIDSLTRAGNPNAKALADTNVALKQLERFWTDYINNVYKMS
jgi:DNA-binding MarR family transcriptional regulator